MIFSLVYRIRSIIVTRFCQWASDYVEQLNSILSSRSQNLLKGAGKIINEQAKK